MVQMFASLVGALTGWSGMWLYSRIKHMQLGKVMDSLAKPWFHTLEGTPLIFTADTNANEIRAVAPQGLFIIMPARFGMRRPLHHRYEAFIQGRNMLGDDVDEVVYSDAQTDTRIHGFLTEASVSIYPMYSLVPSPTLIARRLFQLTWHWVMAR